MPKRKPAVGDMYGDKEPMLVDIEQPDPSQSISSPIKMETTTTPSSSSSLSSLCFRSLLPRDHDQIKALHEEWFPVTYKPEFYSELVNNRMVNSGEELFTCAAVYPQTTTPTTSSFLEIENGETCCLISNNNSSDSNTNGSGVRVGLPRQLNYGQIGKGNKNGTGVMTTRATTAATMASSLGDTIVGCVVGVLVPVSNMPEDTRGLLVSDSTLYQQAFYIMTLGCTHRFRHMRLGTTLVERVIHMVEQDPTCGVLYLHVITFNQAAIQFYEKLGFCRVKEIQDYYRIGDDLHNCYLYARYFHGNRGQRDWFYLLSSYVSSVWKHVWQPWNLISYSKSRNDIR